MLTIPRPLQVHDVVASAGRVDLETADIKTTVNAGSRSFISDFRTCIHVEGIERTVNNAISHGI